MAADNYPGVWVLSTDFYIPYDEKIIIPCVNDFEGAMICSLPIIDEIKSTYHGVLRSDEQGFIKSIHYESVSEGKMLTYLH